jgi:hypothetical protein
VYDDPAEDLRNHAMTEMIHIYTRLVDVASGLCSIIVQHTLYPLTLVIQVLYEDLQCPHAQLLWREDCAAESDPEVDPLILHSELVSTT